MDTTPGTSTIRTHVRRGFGAAGAAVAVAFVGTAALGADQAQAAGISTGHRYAAEPASQRQHRPRPAAHPANLPPATTLAVRCSFRPGGLIRL